MPCSARLIRRLSATLLWWLCLLLLPSTASGTESIRIEQASSHFNNDILLVNAELRYEFSQQILEALNNGIAITLKTVIECWQQRALLWDQRIAKIKYSRRLEYHALTDQFSLVDPGTSTRQNYSALEDAIAALGQIKELPLIERRHLNPKSQYYNRIRAYLDLYKLPGPLRLSAYLSSDWRLSSDWYSWEVNP